MDANGSPRARPGLRFANRIYENSPLNPNKRSISTPQTAPSRRTLTRDEPAQEPSSLKSSISGFARNIFSMSSQTNSSNPSTTPFAPKLPAETKTKVFAPGSTPASKKVYREVTAQASPRGMATATAPVELFTMRIPSPPPEYTGKKLAEQIPSRLDSKGTVYADEFLQHLVPAEYDDLQRRQLFCILDLRRLKYSANEIFAKKDWKINITAFAKEYEKSRSLIMVRYGLYEWKGNAKPAPSVMRKWRKANGLPEIPDDEVTTPASSKSAVRGSKRKADEEASPDVEEVTASGASKRRAFERSAAPSATPAPSSKRKASVSEDSEEQQPAKKSSSTKAMFEQSWNNKNKPVEAEPAEPVKAAPKPAPAAPPKSNPFAALSKPVNGGPVESVLTKGAPSHSTGNIFGRLSDSSAQNSGQDADTESEADEDDDNDTQDATQQSDEPSVVASGGVGTPQPTANIFAQKTTALVPHVPSAAASRESTPGRSLFDRVQQGADGQPLRDSVDPVSKPAATEPKPAEKPVNATWNPDSPIKFGTGASTSAPAPAAGNIFGASTSSTTSGTGLFGAAKPVASTGTGLFGAAKPADAPAASSIFGAAKPAEAAPAPSGLFGASKEPAKTGASLFGAAPPAQDKPAGGLFGAAAPSQDKPTGGLFGAASAQPKPASALFGAAPAQDKPAGALFGAAPAQDKPASALFGAAPAQDKPAGGLFGSSNKPEEKAASEADKSGESDKENEAKKAKPSFGGFTPKPVESSAASPAPSFTFGASKPDENKPAASGLFGASAAPVLGSSTLFGASKPADSATPSEPSKPLFGAAAPAPASNMFGGSAPPAGGLFGQNSSAAAPTSNLFGANNASKPATPSFSFGATPAAPASPAPSATPLFGASPMKQDDKQDERPAKRTFGGSQEAAPASSSFTFGQTNGQSSAPTGGMFGSSNAPQTNGSASSSFTFGGSSGPAVNNPFSNGASAPAPAGGMFAFGGGSTTPAGGNSGASTPFAFGSGAPAAPAASSPFQFGGAAPSQPSSAAPAASPFQFGGASQAAPSLNFTSASPQPQAESNIFAPKPNPPGGSMFNLQPPGAGASTSGTNSPFNFGGASSLATTPATGTPEPTADREKTSTAGPKPDQAAPGAEGADESEDKPHEQISLTSGGPGEEDEEVVHEVRCKVLKFVPAGKDGDKGSGDDTPQKNKSPWQTQGVGPFRLLRHKTTGTHRMLVRAEPRGHVVLNRSMLPNVPYTAEAKYVKMATSNETGDGLETWMIQVKNADIAKELAKLLEEKKKGGGE
ncbi:RanBP1 domain-containing protein [Plectosphaerella plurivora]|uniref:RanBP1 domain-containing protein n=1 Tax=Plectosphaerella plurivora TaxID=936078 RepID=A0A9P8VNG3_9PEZI|nr:RanBP1 domain-containing protein [Plectosphaerella plurivora]